MFTVDKLRGVVVVAHTDDLDQDGVALSLAAKLKHRMVAAVHH
jgi:hypothetical protein